MRGWWLMSRESRANMDLSKRIYDVRDAFRNVVQGVMGTPVAMQELHANGHPGTHRVRGLAATCAVVVGQRLEEQRKIHREEINGETQLEDEDREFVDSLYEAVPLQYRRCAETLPVNTRRS